MRLKTVKSCLHKPQSPEGKAAKRAYQNVTSGDVAPHGLDRRNRARHQAVCLACRKHGVPEPGHVAGRSLVDPSFDSAEENCVKLYGWIVPKQEVPAELLDALEG